MLNVLIATSCCGLPAPWALRIKFGCLDTAFYIQYLLFHSFAIDSLQSCYIKDKGEESKGLLFNTTVSQDV